MFMKMSKSMLRRLSNKWIKKPVVQTSKVVSPFEGNPTQSEQTVRADRQVNESIEELQKETLEQLKKKPAK
jgi:hypothetical protein